MRWTGRPADGRSWSVRRYRLCTRVELVPHVGHEAVGDVVRSMSVISSAISTCSMSKPGRSGKSIIEKMCTSGYGKSRKIVQLLSISHLRSAELRKIQSFAVSYRKVCHHYLSKKSSMSSRLYAQSRRQTFR